MERQDAYNGQADIEVRAEFRRQVNSELAAIRADASEMRADAHATRSDMQELKLLLRGLTESLIKIDARTERIVEHVTHLDKTQTVIASRTDALEKDTVELWTKHQLVDEWKQQIEREMTAKIQRAADDAALMFRQAMEIGEASNKKADSIIDRFKGIGYAWALIGVAAVSGTTWLVSQVSTLTTKVAVIEADMSGFHKHPGKDSSP